MDNVFGESLPLELPKLHDFLSGANPEKLNWSEFRCEQNPGLSGPGLNGPPNTGGVVRLRVNARPKIGLNGRLGLQPSILRHCLSILAS